MKAAARTVLASLALLALNCAHAFIVAPAAKEEPAVDVDWSAEFSAVKDAYAAAKEGLEARVAAGDWQGVMTQAQGLDQSFRKRLMGGLRKRFPKESKALKEEALLLCNAVTFDLIAINKAGRSKDEPAAREALAVLDADVGKFLALEPQLLQ
ncbi:hypothetical protein JKP88DRAFT_349024 [Tribonema minus]|uniref:Uncharacterized protein n=1 Tax=Tribonema minus TaxID=303371 RepID=A0A835YZ48_9STRA|nr:hypothetical protein JKP88DRAFT_349024 [Tribonema minus]